MLFRVVKTPRLTALASGSAVFAAILGALLANAIYKEAVLLKTGDEMRRPPFLAMRVIADGPGRNYLRYACDHGATYYLCQFRNLELTNSQDLLWSDDRKKGIFNVTTNYDDRLQMEREENSFVLHAILYDPIGQIVASTGNWLEELVLVSLDDPLKNPHYYLTNDYWSTTNLPWLINRAADCGRDHWGCGPRLSINGSQWLHGGLTVLGLVLIVWRLCQRDLRRIILERRFDWDDDRTRLLMMIALLLGAVVVNAFVCGALSGPFARYQARITWLITAGASLSALSMVPADLRVRGSWRACSRSATCRWSRRWSGGSISPSCVSAWSAPAASPSTPACCTCWSAWPSSTRSPAGCARSAWRWGRHGCSIAASPSAAQRCTGQLARR